MDAVRPIIVTGSMGLIGAALVAALRHAGRVVVGIDGRPGAEIVSWLKSGDPGLADFFAGAAGVVHLAGVSRVVDGQRDPARCWRENVELSAAILAIVAASPHRPWLIQASSREVLGQPAALPASDETPVAPVNVYGASKAAIEVLLARSNISLATVRFSTVYGSINDHFDRLIPAFVSAALGGQPIRVEGAGVVVDPTHVNDVVATLVGLARRLENGPAPPRPLLLSSGAGITLLELARRVCAITGSHSPVEIRPARNFDVARFWGSSSLAAAYGWRPLTPLDAGLAQLAQALRVAR
jgi:nucleoside-diphosphate-sugar epimerase